MLGVFAEFETNLRKERQAEGIEAAKARGGYKAVKRASIPKPYASLLRMA
jgi:DNA invertase Pin-like site-specific DNA recombinase